jgi:hypothetical protein
MITRRDSTSPSRVFCHAPVLDCDWRQGDLGSAVSCRDNKSILLGKLVCGRSGKGLSSLFNTDCDRGVEAVGCVNGENGEKLRSYATDARTRLGAVQANRSLVMVRSVWVFSESVRADSGQAEMEGRAGKCFVLIAK